MVELKSSEDLVTSTGEIHCFSEKNVLFLWLSGMMALSKTFTSSRPRIVTSLLRWSLSFHFAIVKCKYHHILGGALRMKLKRNNKIKNSPTLADFFKRSAALVRFKCDFGLGTKYSLISYHMRRESWCIINECKSSYEII